MISSLSTFPGMAFVPAEAFIQEQRQPLPFQLISDYRCGIDAVPDEWTA